MRLIVSAVLLSSLSAAPLLAQEATGSALQRADVSLGAAADSAAIRATALDYIEGWFAGDAARMERALHPELVKRILVTDEETGRDWVDGMGMTKLVEGTRHGYGREIPADERRSDVSILDITGRAASVKVDAGRWVDYMHLVRENGEWKILNVLWEMQ